MILRTSPLVSDGGNPYLIEVMIINWVNLHITQDWLCNNKNNINYELLSKDMYKTVKILTIRENYNLQSSSQN